MNREEYFGLREKLENDFYRYFLIWRNMPKDRFSANKKYLEEIYSSLIENRESFEGRNFSRDGLYRKQMKLEKVFENTLKDIYFEEDFVRKS